MSPKFTYILFVYVITFSFKCSGQFRVAKTNSIDGDQNDGVCDIMGGKGGHEAINSPAS